MTISKRELEAEVRRMEESATTAERVLAERVCAHTFRADLLRDVIRCGRCNLSVSGQALYAAGFRRQGAEPSYDDKRNRLADECQRLTDENRDLHARISRLERQLERRR